MNARESSIPSAVAKVLKPRAQLQFLDGQNGSAAPLPHQPTKLVPAGNRCRDVRTELLWSAISQRQQIDAVGSALVPATGGLCRE